MIPGTLERELAPRLGVTREVLRDLRKRLLSSDEYEQQGRDVIISHGGVAKLTGAVLEKREGEKNGVEIDVEQPEECALKVFRNAANTRIVLAKKEGAEDMLRVRVRNNGHFVPGMPLRARHIEGDLYELVGRCPRFKGRY